MFGWCSAMLPTSTTQSPKIPANREPTRGFEPRTPSLRVKWIEGLAARPTATTAGWRTYWRTVNKSPANSHFLNSLENRSGRKSRGGSNPSLSAESSGFLDREPLRSGGLRSSNRSAQSKDVHRRLQASIDLRHQWRTTGVWLSGSTTVRRRREAMLSPRLLRQHNSLPPKRSAA